MRLSLVIAAHNEGESLWKTVQSCVETCAGLDYEIVVADDASWDGCVDETLKRFPQIRVVRHEERLGPSPTKDLGGRNARGDVLVFLDGHTKPEPGAIRRLVESVELHRGNAVITPAITGLDVGRWKPVSAQIGHGYFVELERFDCGWLPLGDLKKTVHRGRTFYESPAAIGCAFAVRRELYDDLRGFDPHMRSWGVEDLDFSLKCWLLGHPILHDPAAVVAHRFRKGFDNFDVPIQDLVTNQLRMAYKNFTPGVWREWIDRCRRRHPGRIADHPEGLWACAWRQFEERRESAEQERAYLMFRRVRDEFWYAERFNLLWPRLQAERFQPAASVLEAMAAEASPSPSAPPGEIINIRYIAGNDTGDAKKETGEYFANDDKYFMKGYMLELESPPIKAGTDVIWTVKRANVERGTYHPKGNWTDYFTAISPKPKSRTVFWRSDYSATESLPQTYRITCTYTPVNAANTVTLTRDIESRELNPDDAAVRDNVNTDTKMVQRAVIQVFGLDKGRLDSWVIGKYQKNGGTPPYYHSTSGGGGAGRNWSKIAEEISNFDKFVLGTSGPSYRLKPRQVAGIWTQFQLILSAGNIGQVRLNDVNVGNAIAAAHLTPPAGFPKTASDIVSAICKKEGGRVNPYHSYTKHSPLAINSVRVGTVLIGAGASLHVYTDWGIGFAAVQPYNAGGKNLYKPNDNLLRCAEYYKGILNGPKVPAAATGPKAKVWYACYGYNQGPNAIPQNSTPLALRNDGTDGAKYADDVFDYMNVTPPNANTD